MKEWKGCQISKKNNLELQKKTKKTEYPSQMCFLNFSGQKYSFGMLDAQNI